MADTIMYTNEGALSIAQARQTAQAASKIRLFKSTLTLTPATTAVELIAAEATFSGYPAGGAAVAAFNDPILAQQGGYSIQSPLVQFVVATPATVTDLIGGWWLELADGTVIMAAQYGDPRPMQVPGQGLPITVQQVFPNQ